jgi:hypothetical protein
MAQRERPVSKKGTGNGELRLIHHLCHVVIIECRLHSLQELALFTLTRSHAHTHTHARALAHAHTRTDFLRKVSELKAKLRLARPELTTGGGGAGGFGGGGRAGAGGAAGGGGGGRGRGGGLGSSAAHGLHDKRMKKTHKRQKKRGGYGIGMQMYATHTRTHLSQHDVSVFTHSLPKQYACVCVRVRVRAARLCLL